MKEALHPINPWIEEPELLGFGGHNKNHVWNVMSPELEFCQYVQDQLAQLTTETFQGLFVVETGVGQGFVSRRIIEVLRRQDAYLGYDTDDYFLGLIPKTHYEERVQFTQGSPESGLISLVDFIVLDSDLAVRPKELKLWIDFGRPGSHLIIHDTPEYQNGPAGLSKVIARSGIEGHYTDNLRGGWHGIHP